MSMPFYVAPEQWMKDKADFARKGIARGRALAALTYADGILICAENSSATLRKVSEIYDRIAFAGAGKYNEYDRLRIAGVRHADLKGYSFSREDVDAQSLANAYAQMLGDVFTHEAKPMEVEIVVAEVGDDPSDDRLFHILYDGTVVDEHGFTVLGGEADAIGARLKDTYTAGQPLDAALQAAVGALAGSERQLTAKGLEVAVLSRGNGRRAFRRLTDDEVGSALGGEAVAPEPQADVAPATSTAEEAAAAGDADEEPPGPAGGPEPDGNGPTGEDSTGDAG
ncbi:MAG: proteasome subunit alpha [Acidimicrobiales bacterium]|nr:proteasome subunit alpha [Acidimicrobiales bacterium]